MVEHAEAERRRGEYLVSTDTTQLDVPFVHRFQSTYV
jgi:hypothetical protein